LVNGYLFDTNHVKYRFDKNPNLFNRLREIPPDAPIVISAITLGEIEYGHKVAAPSGPTQIQRDFIAFVQKNFPLSIPITEMTTSSYGMIRARLFERFAPKKRKRKGLRPEELLDPVTSRVLGIQENDLWIAAQALERNLVLVTNDSIVRVKEVVPELQVENWSRP
jgi:predicted nucleic acid-binding protein